MTKRIHWNGLIRTSHRWLSMLFTLTVIANFVAIFAGKTITWLYYIPLPPLFLLLFSGLYLFALPYFQRHRAAS